MIKSGHLSYLIYYIHYIPLQNYWTWMKIGCPHDGWMIGEIMWNHSFSTPQFSFVSRDRLFLYLYILIHAIRKIDKNITNPEVSSFEFLSNDVLNLEASHSMVQSSCPHRNCCNACAPSPGKAQNAFVDGRKSASFWMFLLWLYVFTLFLLLHMLHKLASAWIASNWLVFDNFICCMFYSHSDTRINKHNIN